MEITTTILNNLLNQAPSLNKLFLRNLLKEYLQILVLDFIYSHKKYSQLIFYGGSCLKHCFGLPRLSEDLDFVDLKAKINLIELAKDLKNYFIKETDLTLKTNVQKFRIYLKFPLLYQLDLAQKGASDLLFLKVEIFSNFDFCQNYKTEIIPLFKFNKSTLIKTFDLETLMSTKIMAVLHRKWEKTDKTGRVLAKIKGRDYFDLMWYLQKEIKPNLKCIEQVKSIKELKAKLLKLIEQVDAKSIKFDLEPLIKDVVFVKNLSKEIKGILKREVQKL